MQEMQVRSLDWVDLLEKEMSTHSSILAWEIPWTEEPGQLQPIGSQRVRYYSTLHNRDNRYIVVSHFYLCFLNSIGSAAYFHMFICLHFSSLVMCLLRSLAHFLARLLVSLLLSYESSLYI